MNIHETTQLEICLIERLPHVKFNQKSLNRLSKYSLADVLQAINDLVMEEYPKKVSANRVITDISNAVFANQFLAETGCI